jgi:hypothetical protein
MYTVKSKRDEEWRVSISSVSRQDARSMDLGRHPYCVSAGGVADLEDHLGFASNSASVDRSHW